LTHTLVSPCFGRKPKARVATLHHTFEVAITEKEVTLKEALNSKVEVLSLKK
jgi:hypothetical protein